ncbi:MAG: Asp-tRNA(Asn)/Glu-tRNA(Gln) amidotransferase GatCAB subunit B, partial [Bacilli bacterium]
EGSMRCDVNISVSKDDNLGVRSEIKNIGSISNIGDAIDHEIKRQSLILEAGEQLFEDTRRFDSETGTTIFMRKKEPNKDYRYFPEPDIPYLVLDEEMIENEQNSLIMLPNERRRIYLSKGVSKINIEKLISNKDLSDFFGNFLDSNINLTIASNILVGDIASFLNKKKISIFDTKLTKDKFIVLVNSLDKEEISSKIFKEILPTVMEEDVPIETILENNKQTSSKEEIEKVIIDVLDSYPQSVCDYKKGKESAIKFLMGMVMKETKGKINPKLAMEILKDNLDK